MSEPRLKKVIHAHTAEQRRAEPHVHDYGAARIPCSRPECRPVSDGGLQRRVEPLTAEDIRVAIDKACSLTNPRLSEVDWDDVAVLLRRTLATPDPRVERLEAALREVEGLLHQHWSDAEDWDEIVMHPMSSEHPRGIGHTYIGRAVQVIRAALLRSPQERSGK